MDKVSGGDAATLVLVIVFAALASGSARADLLVLNSTEPNIKPGQVLTARTTLTLPNGGAVTLLAQDGRTIHATGPWSGTLDAADSRSGDPRVVTVLSRLLVTSPADKTSLGVTRGVDLRGPFTIRPEGGAHCQVATTPPTFEREPVGRPERLTIADTTGGQAALTWPADTETLPWPGSLPFHDGSYTLRMASNPKPVTLTVHHVPASLATKAAVAAWMAETGCTAQALALLATIQ